MCVWIYMRTKEAACGAMVTFIGDGTGDLNSNPGQGCLNFSYH